MRNWLIFLGFALAGCTPTGAIAVTAWGEHFIETGIPADATADGWTVSYSRFLITLGDFSIAHESETAAVPGFKLWDMTKTGPHAIATIENLPAIRFEQAGYVVKPADTSTALGNATQADLDEVKAAGASLLVAGTLTKGEVTKTFSWTFPTATEYVDCRNEEDGDGVVVTPGGTTGVELTIHGDHLFLDDLVKADATPHVQPAADADADSDGVVTLDELAAVDLTSLPADRYGTGSVPNVRTLKDFISAQARTVGHWRGEGECRITAP